MKASKDLVMKVGFWEHLALVIVFFVIASVANGVLAILAVPFMIVAVTASYCLADGKEEALARA